MGVDVSKLKSSLVQLKRGTTNVSITFYGVIDGAADNPVKLELLLEPKTPVFFIDGKRRLKNIKLQKQFSSEPQQHTWPVQIEVTEQPEGPQGCSLRLESADNLGYKSIVNSFVIYH